MEPEWEQFEPRPPRQGVWAAMNADPQLRDDLRALRRGGAVALTLLFVLFLVVAAHL